MESVSDQLMAMWWDPMWARSDSLKDSLLIVTMERVSDWQWVDWNPTTVWWMDSRLAARRDQPYE